MSGLYNLDEWELNETISNDTRYADIEVYLKYPDKEQFIEFGYKERIKKIDQIHKLNLKKLIDLNIFSEHTVLGTKKRPRGVNAKVKFNELEALVSLDFVDGISIKSIDNAKRIATDEIIFDTYFCVKMTVVIEVEGVSSKRQSTEQRFVLIKALSSDDAYDKLEKEKDAYASPYLNSDGRFVRWRIESFDDCYQTDIVSPGDIDKPEGVEVYSKLKERRVKSNTFWDGKF